ncbi:nicotinate phosphoribosyltransferase [Aphanothece hegewaldii CCALA 016]|uniref:Nicotinate phosphoribosyltransferase n=1 Tax=Aphanothece hegewaldii CCALA 016 TaxID=2107694 RepID=A0A2T1M363_9CHRO|nr:nicotinate phosphoribosyltransferase [Aphanothece hegewaldii]PSF39281.1 nicotinate phosphoribosyltransferase [Aphanothece hegewaldii CCALA 016]
MTPNAQTLNPTPDDYSLLTDLYQLTMIACYCGEGIENYPASFELFTRRLPPNFGYLIAMGLAQGLEYLQSFHFTSNHLEALEKTGIFTHAPKKFWSTLASGKFTGDVYAVAEGSPIFANEPILRIEAPLWQAQLVETYLLNTINYQTLIATKSARIRDVAGDDAILLEFGTRRAFSPQGAMWAARAALAAGLDSTSNVATALKLGIKPSGTMAHSFIMAVGALEGGEDEAFRIFHRYFPNAPLLIDTYDTIEAAKRLSEQIKAGKIQVSGVRIDSGDLVTLSQKVRGFLPDSLLFASGDLDEWEITRLKELGACFDGYGLGTKLVTGTPVNGVYKLVEIKGIPTMKKSTDKITYPGRKQIFRSQDDLQIYSDRIALIEETPNHQEIPLLELVMKQGEVIQQPESLTTIQQRTRINVTKLPPSTRQINAPNSLSISLSTALKNLIDHA